MRTQAIIVLTAAAALLAGCSDDDADTRRTTHKKDSSSSRVAGQTLGTVTKTRYGRATVTFESQEDSTRVSVQVPQALPAGHYSFQTADVHCGDMGGVYMDAEIVTGDLSKHDRALEGSIDLALKDLADGSHQLILIGPPGTSSVPAACVDVPSMRQ